MIYLKTINLDLFFDIARDRRVTELNKQLVVAVKNEQEFYDLMIALDCEHCLKKGYDHYRRGVDGHDNLAFGFSVSYRARRAKWAGYCWKEYYLGSKSQYEVIDFEEILENDFEFDQKMALTYLFGLG